MGYKTVCLSCQKSFSLGTDIKNIRESSCQQCGQKMVLLNQKFRPPKKDSKKWEAIKILVENGFKFQKIFSMSEPGVYLPVPYPTTLKEAGEFMVTYKTQALNE